MKEKPIRPWHFWIPFVMSLVAGYLHEKGYSPVAWVGALVIAGFCIMWYFSYMEITERTRRNESESEKMDAFRKLTPDERAALGYIEMPEARLKIETITRGSDGRSVQRIEYDWLPVHPAAFSEFARAVLDGAPLTFERWTGAGKLFSRGQYEDLIAALEKLEYIQQINPRFRNDGFEMTPQGLTVFYQYVEGDKVTA